MTQTNEIGKTYQRPWGMYKTIELQNGFQAKVIEVNPGGRLSLQSHQHRAEHWVVVKGEPTVTVGDDVKQYQVSDHIFIPRQAKHRLENTTTDTIMIVEVQIGDYLGEDDIVRYDDVYGRN